jgi:hypothetical protein
MKNKKYLIAALVCSIALTSFSVYFFTKWLPIYDVEQLVKQQLNDPKSAIFSGHFENKENGARCGYVNSKNKFGGYPGDTFFVIDRDGIVEFTPDEIDQEAYLKRLDQKKKYLNPLMAKCYGED